MGNGYSSIPDTLRHAIRVGTLMGQAIRELVTRSMEHDHSKTVLPEQPIFDEYTPKLAGTTYGSAEYKEHLAGMREGLDHHYANNRHHPEHFASGINGMTLVDLIEMLADWRAATERHDDGSLRKSLMIQQDRFNISDQLIRILENTARFYGWLDCGQEHTAPDGTKMRCSRVEHPLREVCADGRFEPYEWGGW